MAGHKEYAVTFEVTITLNAESVIQAEDEVLKLLEDRLSGTGLEHQIVWNHTERKA